jgi:hypothetical protein
VFPGDSRTTRRNLLKQSASRGLACPIDPRPEGTALEWESPGEQERERA